MSRTDVPSVREELGDPSIQELSDDRIETFIRRASHLIDKNVPSSRHGEHLVDVETLVAAHFAHGEVTGENEGRRVVRASESDGRLEFEGSGDSAYGEKSPYWARAVELEPALEYPGAVFEVF